MASQYITFMIIFTLGLSLVIITNGIFLSVSEQFKKDIAEIEMDQNLKLIQSQLYQNLLLKTSSLQTIEQKIELPVLLGRQYQYSIEISNSDDNNTIILRGITLNEEIDQTITFTLGKKYDLIASGKFQSTTALLTLLVQKTVTTITITIS